MGRAAATPLNRQQILGFWAAWFGWMLDGMDSVIYALVLSPAMKELLPQIGFAQQTRRCRLCRFGPVRAFPAWLGAFLHLGPDRRSFWPRQMPGRDHPDLFHLHRRGGLCPYRLGAGTFPVSGRHRHWRRMGHGRHLCRRSLAGRSAQGGSRLSADRLLCRLLSCGGAQLSPSGRNSAGAPCSCAAQRRSWSRFLPCHASRSRSDGSEPMPVRASIPSG